MKAETPTHVLGWREWLALPDLGIDRIKAKIDTGARTSCLHAFYIEPFRQGRRDWVRFDIHPLQNNTRTVLSCRAPVLDQRLVSDSGGHRERRFVISTRVRIMHVDYPIEITLSNRDSMRFRMLLGRTALIEAGFIVDPAAAYLAGKL